ncbi:lamin tail domain-containing protein [Candidatus Parcubacteria bacterium]|nr:lamin tail domain-containing protein [Candidatus Parcubacteria bacterium]
MKKKLNIALILSIVVIEFFYFTESRAVEQKVVINEIAWMGTELSSNDEWIELKNLTNENIDLTGWRIEAYDGSPSVNLEGIISGNGYFLLERSNDDSVTGVDADLIYIGALGNSGEVLDLFDSDDNLIYTLDSSEGWQAGCNEEKYTMEFFEGSWQNSVEIGGSPRSKNVKNESEFIDEEISNEAVASSSSVQVNEESETTTSSNSSPTKLSANGRTGLIIISEIFPNPIGADNNGEFIELQNIGKRSIDLYRWRIGNNCGQDYIFKEKTIIGAGKFFILKRSRINLALNNKGDSIKLYKPLKEKFYKKIDYKNAEIGASYSFDKISEEWIWSEIITPGEENEIKIIDLPPIVDFEYLEIIKVGEKVIFDGSDSIDPNGKRLNFLWNLGDGVEIPFSYVEHVYNLPGKYLVKLIVSDGNFEIKKEVEIKVVDDIDDIQILEVINIGNAEVVISELLPNPEGLDSTGEWIEVYNSGEEVVNLNNWKIDDGEGGSAPYEFINDVYLDPGEFYIIDRNESGIALNNSVDSVRLFNGMEKIVDDVEYKDVKEGYSYSKIGDAWEWSNKQTPGKENIVLEKEQIILNKQIKEVMQDEIEKSFDDVYYKPISLIELDKIELGTKIITHGFVTVLPGIISSQYFYVQNEKGAQVYNYKKDFLNDMELGDEIEIIGELGRVNNEYRIKIKSSNDIKLLSMGNNFVADEVLIQNINRNYLSKLLKISGEVLEIKNSSIFIDDNTGEFEVYIKQNSEINKKYFKEGDRIKVIGILTSSGSKLRLLPRMQDDIEIIEQNIAEPKGEVLGEIVKNTTWKLEERNKDKEYLLSVLVGFVFVIIIGFFGFKFYKNRM